MTDLPIARTTEVFGGDSIDSVTLDYAGRFLRRRVLTTDAGHRILVDLPKTVSLVPGHSLVLTEGPRIAIRAAHEAVLVVTGPDLARLAWHIGNRHTPCQIERDRLVIQADGVIATMLAHLGARVTEDRAPFLPEGGAYGHGRTHAHEHGNTVHGPG